MAQMYAKALALTSVARVGCGHDTYRNANPGLFFVPEPVFV